MTQYKNLSVEQTIDKIPLIGGLINASIKPLTEATEQVNCFTTAFVKAKEVSLETGSICKRNARALKEFASGLSGIEDCFLKHF